MILPLLNAPKLSFRPDPGSTLCLDFDGPIADVSRRYYRTYRLALARTRRHFRQRGETLHLHPLRRSHFWQMKQERSPDEEIALRSGLRHTQIEVFLQHVQHIVNRESLLHLDQLQPGVAEALRQLRVAGLRLVLVTLRPTAEAAAILAEAGLLDYFDDICGSHESAAAYSNLVASKQELLAQAILRTELRTGQAPLCLIGDTEADVLAAKAMGLISVALTCGIRSARYLRRLAPDVILPNLLTCARLIAANRSEVSLLPFPSLA